MKELQSRDQERECHLWLTKKLYPRKTSPMTDMLEQSGTRSWKVARGLIEDGRCRVCFEQIETVEHLVTGCKVLANGEYLSRHNRALIILAIGWAENMISLSKMWLPTPCFKMFLERSFNDPTPHHSTSSIFHCYPPPHPPPLPPPP